jgi:RNA polymerase sigma-B factor
VYRRASAWSPNSGFDFVVDDLPGIGCSFGDLLPARSAEIELEDRLALPGLLCGLNDLERQVVTLRFFYDLNQSQIGVELGYSQVHISRLLQRALSRMRDQLPA